MGAREAAVPQSRKFQPFFGQNAWNSGNKPIENKPTNLNNTSKTNCINRNSIENIQNFLIHKYKFLIYLLSFPFANSYYNHVSIFLANFAWHLSLIQF